MLAMMLVASALAPVDTAATILPAEFIANRVYVVPRTTSGKTLKLFTDTGGGLFVTEATVRRLKLATTESTDAEAAGPARRLLLTTLPPFKSSATIPPPPDNDWQVPVMPDEEAHRHHSDDDGMLGQVWFGGHVWTWDYPQHQLRLESGAWKPEDGATRVALAFAQEDGVRANNFARITIRVDAKPIDMLLDTGATTTLSAAAVKALGDKLPARRATSFIVESQYIEWRRAHPDWRVIDKADFGKMSMIEVPRVELGGASVGPIWFTWREDSNFHDYMSSRMDQQVEGAIGGNAFAHFVMTIDYPGAAAWFRCVVDCAPAHR